MTHHDDAGAFDAPACSLSPAVLQERIGEWRSLMAQALTREAGTGRVRATYPNRPDIARRLDELIAAENECCSFLEFDVQPRGDMLEVELRHPPEFAGLGDEARPVSPTQCGS
jgi:hypothetical protein